MREILRSFKQDWRRWSPGERLGALMVFAIAIPLVLGSVGELLS